MRTRPALSRAKLRRAARLDREGGRREITLDGILVIDPCNAQVVELRKRLLRARVGMADKFQDQEGPVYGDGEPCGRLSGDSCTARINVAMANSVR